MRSSEHQNRSTPDCTHTSLHPHKGGVYQSLPTGITHLMTSLTSSRAARRAALPVVAEPPVVEPGMQCSWRRPVCEGVAWQPRQLLSGFKFPSTGKKLN